MVIYCMFSVGQHSASIHIAYMDNVDEVFDCEVKDRFPSDSIQGVAINSEFLSKAP